MGYNWRFLCCKHLQFYKTVTLHLSSTSFLVHFILIKSSFIVEVVISISLISFVLRTYPKFSLSLSPSCSLSFFHTLSVTPSVSRSISLPLSRFHPLFFSLSLSLSLSLFLSISFFLSSSINFSLSPSFLFSLQIDQARGLEQQMRDNASKNNVEKERRGREDADEVFPLHFILCLNFLKVKAIFFYSIFCHLQPYFFLIFQFYICSCVLSWIFVSTLLFSIVRYSSL